MDAAQPFGNAMGVIVLGMRVADDAFQVGRGESMVEHRAPRFRRKALAGEPVIKRPAAFGFRKRRGMDQTGISGQLAVNLCPRRR